MYPTREDHRRRVRAAVRHQPPRPLRAHRPAAGQPAAGRGLARGDGRQHRPPHPAPDPLRRPAVGTQLQPGRRLRAVQAGQPDVHLRAAAPARGQGRHRPSRSPRIPAAPNTELMRHLPGRSVRSAEFVWNLVAQAPTMGALPTLRAATDPACTAASTTDPTGSASSAATRSVVQSSTQSHDVDRAAAAVDGVRGADRREVPGLMRSVEEHQRVVADLITAAAGALPLAEALGLVLAADVVRRCRCPASTTRRWTDTP